jgi:cysteine-rich repeat protein
VLRNQPGALDVCAPTCGDGIRVTGRVFAEACDDNNTISGDGCSGDCAVEPGYKCAGGTTKRKDSCATVCGDGLRVGGEVLHYYTIILLYYYTTILL